VISKALEDMTWKKARRKRIGCENGVSKRKGHPYGSTKCLWRPAMKIDLKVRELEKER